MNLKTGFGYDIALEVANWWIEYSEKPDDLYDPSLALPPLACIREVYRVLEAAFRALERHRRGEELEELYNDSKFVLFDPKFLKRVKSHSHHVNLGLKPGLDVPGKSEVDKRPRLDWDLVTSTPDPIASYDMYIYMLLSKPEVCEALRQCPECGRFFLSTHKQKKYCRRKCAQETALYNYYRRKEEKDGRRYWNNRRKRKKLNG